MKVLHLIFVVLITMFTTQTLAQSVVGFWGVTSVTVGERNMTPVAKWFNYNQDGTFLSGNGWTQNSTGTWEYNDKTKEFVPTSTNGLKDGYGPFHVSFDGEQMIWERDEDGMKVVVSLVRINEMPASPSDLIKGLWVLSKVTDKNKQQLTDFETNHKQFIHIRPDMRYGMRNPDESFAQGFWHMDGHRPIFTLINDDRTIGNQVYEVSFDKELLVMEVQDEQGLVYHYTRVYEFPE